MAEKPIYKCSFVTNHFTLFQNRLEVVQNPLVFGQKEVIKLGNIAEVIQPYGKRIEIHMVNGKVFVLNIVGEPANKLLKKINEACQRQE